MDIFEWLGCWEDIEPPAKHDIKYPADGACGYQFYYCSYGSKAPRAERVYTMWDRVNRAIPVDGTVKDPPPSWERSPQASFWLRPEKESWLTRLIRWLKSPVIKSAAGTNPGGMSRTQQ